MGVRSPSLLTLNARAPSLGRKPHSDKVEPHLSLRAGSSRLPPSPMGWAIDTPSRACYPKGVPTSSVLPHGPVTTVAGPLLFLGA